jgi:uncharacterized protein YuzE
MQLEFDLNVGALYVKLSDEEIARTREAGGNAAVDLDVAGNVVGIEVISTAHPWPLDDILRDYRIPDEEQAEIRAYFGASAAAPEIGIGSRPPTLVAALPPPRRVVLLLPALQRLG